MIRSINRATLTPVLLLLTMAVLLGCSSGEAPPATETTASAGGVSLPNALLLSLAVLERDADGKPVPQPAELGILQLNNGVWEYRHIEDPDSNVFHKAMVYEPTPGDKGIVTLGGSQAVVRFLRPGKEPEVLWQKDFGGRFSRMRDGEAADLFGDGTMALAIATHDQGVVAVVRPTDDGFAVEEIDQQEETFVHEIEIGDLDGDGVLEVYATPSARNKLDGSPQPGSVTRYVPASGEGRVVVADLGDRHAKEILVDDVDGDGRDELYAAVEAVSGGKVEIRRYDAGTDPGEGRLIAEIDDQLLRFLTAGDWDGDGHKEMVAAAHKKGLWLLRPGATAEDPWSVKSIDKDSTGFEHAALFTDLDGDGTDELYVASDKHGEVRRYLWQDGAPVRQVIWKHPGGITGFTWNLMPTPVELLP